MLDLLIIGGGPIGSYLALKAAQSGFSTAVIEEHQLIGEPVHCTGVVGEKLFNDFPLPTESILGSLPRFLVASPSGEEFSIPLTSKVYLIDRKTFDQTLARLAQKAGVSYYLNTKVTEIEQQKDHIKVEARSNGETIPFTSKLGILATGAISRLPQTCGLQLSPGFLGTIQTDIKLKGLQGAEVYLGHHVAPGSFAYAVSLNQGEGKIGVISQGNLKENFQTLLKHPYLKDRIESIDHQIKPRKMPLGLSEKTVNWRLASVGDSAGQVKATTGGGIYFGLKCAELLHQVIIGARKNCNFSPGKIAIYQTRFKKLIGNEVYWGIIVRELFKDITDPLLNRLVQLLNQPKMQKLVIQKGEYDAHKKIIIGTLSSPLFREFMWDFFKTKLKKEKHHEPL